MGYVIVFLGGGLGSALRLGVNQLAVRLFGINFPFGTLTVNIVGSLLIGLIAGYFAHMSEASSQEWRLFLTTGILGGFTTFSAFSLDVALLWERSEFGLAVFYVLASVGISLVAMFAGLALVRHFS